MNKEFTAFFKKQFSALIKSMKQVPEIPPPPPPLTFCVSPWIETILHTDSFLSPCCVADPIKDKNGRIYNLVEDGLEGYWNSWGLREVRRKMLTGRKVSECEWCYYDESIGKISKRQGSNIDWLKKNRYGRYTRDILDRVEKSKTNGYRVEKSPLRLDIRSKNTCNLKCRMCVPRSSSKIEQEQREMLKGGAQVL